MLTIKQRQEIKRRMAGKGHIVKFVDGQVIITSTRKDKEGVITKIPEDQINNSLKSKRIPKE